MQQYLIYAHDGTDEQALSRRMNARPAHFEGAKALKAQGNFILGGALLNADGQMIGSTMVLQFETAAEFQHWYDHEPYIQQGVWQKIEVHPFRVANV